MSDALRVRLRRTGGLFAGNVLDTTLAEQDLPAGEAGRLRELVAAADLPALAAAPPAAGPGADAYQYEITVERPGASSRAVVAGSALPERCRPLVELLERHAEGERG